MHEPMSITLSALRVNCELDKAERLREDNESARFSFERSVFLGPGPLLPIRHTQGRQRGFLLEVDHADVVPGYVLVRDALPVPVRFGRKRIISFGQILTYSVKGVNRRISNASVCHLTVRRCFLDLHWNRQSRQS